MKLLWPYVVALVVGAVLGWLMRHVELAARRMNDENTWRSRARTFETERNRLMGSLEAAEAEVTALKHQVIEAERRYAEVLAGRDAASNETPPGADTTTSNS